MTVDDMDIERIEKSLERLEQKIDIQGDKYLTRTEYEARHATLQNDMSKLSLEIAQKNTWAQGEHNDIRKEMAVRFERVSDTLDSIENKFVSEVQGLKIEIAKSSTDKWKLVAMTLIGALTSGGLLGLIDVIRTVTGH